MKPEIRKKMLSENMQVKIQEALVKLDIRKYSITNVQMGNDLKSAKIQCISIETHIQHSFESRDQIAAAKLNALRHDIMRIIKSEISGRYTPKITFFPDTFYRKDIELQKLIDSL